MKQKIIAILLVAMMVPMLMACGDGATEEREETGIEMDSREDGLFMSTILYYLYYYWWTQVTCGEDVDEADPIIDLIRDYADTKHNDPSATYVVTSSRTASMVESGDVFVLDIRNETDFQAGHIPGAYNAFFVGGHMVDNLDRLPMDKPVHVLCYTGQTASQVTALLRITGFDAHTVRGGASAWTGEGYTLDAVDGLHISEAPVVSSIQADQEHIHSKVQDYFANITANDLRNVISPEALQAALGESPEDFYLMDIRPLEHVDPNPQGFMAMFNHYTWKDISDSIEDLPTDKTIVVICMTGHQAGQATALLRLAGYDARSLRGGMGSCPESGGQEDETDLLEILRDYTDTKHNDPSATYVVPPARAAALIADQDAFVLDIRNADDFAKGHIAGARNAFFVGGNLVGNLDRIPMDMPVLVLCYSGQTASQATALLRVAGFEAYTIRGGQNGWLADGYELEGFDGLHISDALVVAPAEEGEDLIRSLVDEYFAAITAANLRNVISAEGLQAALGLNPEDFYLMDIRPLQNVDPDPQGFMAMFSHYTWKEISDAMEDLPTDKTIIVICMSGHMAGQATAILRLAGYDAKSLVGGMGSCPSQAQ